MYLLHALLFAGLLLGYSEARPGQCNCNCEWKTELICGWDHKTSDSETFKNLCYMICYNCTHKKNYVVVKQGECKKK